MYFGFYFGAVYLGGVWVILEIVEFFWSLEFSKQKNVVLGVEIIKLAHPMFCPLHPKYKFGYFKILQTFNLVQIALVLAALKWNPSW